MADTLTLSSLVRLSVADPERGASAVIGLNPPIAARWMLLALVVVLGTILAYLLPLLGGADGALPSPVNAAMLQAAMNLAAVALVSASGGCSAGRGRSRMRCCWLAGSRSSCWGCRSCNSSSW